MRKLTIFTCQLNEIKMEEQFTAIMLVVLTFCAVKFKAV